MKTFSFRYSNRFSWASSKNMHFTRTCFCVIHTQSIRPNRDPNAEFSIRLELCQFSDKFWKTLRAEINKLITLSSLHIILTCDIPWDILCDEIIALEINPHGRWRTFNHFRNLMCENLGWMFFALWQSLQHCHSSLHRFSRVYLKNKPPHKAVPCAPFCFLSLGVQRDVEKGDHNGPTPGKRETSLQLAHAWFKAGILALCMHFVRIPDIPGYNWLFFPLTRDNHSRHKGLGSDQDLALLWVVICHKPKLTMADMNKSGWEPSTWRMDNIHWWW